MWQKSFVDELGKLNAAEIAQLLLAKLNKSEIGDLIKSLTAGAVGSAAGVTVSHPIEHELYGPTTGKSSWEHYKDRMKKGVLYGSASLGTAAYLGRKFGVK